MLGEVFYRGRGFLLILSYVIVIRREEGLRVVFNYGIVKNLVRLRV